MAKAFVSTCEALGLKDRSDAMTEIVAGKIIELAQRGYKNPTALYLAAIKEFKPATQSSEVSVGGVEQYSRWKAPAVTREAEEDWGR